MTETPRQRRFDDLFRGPWPYIIGAALLAALLCWLPYCLLSARDMRYREASKGSGETLYVPDLRLIRFMTLGYDQAAADLMWLRSIGYFARHFNSDRNYPWLEFLLDQVIALDPKFRRVYHWAGANVLYGQQFTNPNVLRSSRFYELALQHFPDDYEAAYRLGLNYYIEMKSNDPDELRGYKEKGLGYLELAANIQGAPANLRSLVASISRKLGKEQVALQYYIDQYIQTDDPGTRIFLKNRIEEIRRKTSETDDFTKEAMDFQARWQQRFPYLSPTLFTLIDSPEPKDCDWRQLIPGVELDSSK